MNLFIIASKFTSIGRIVENNSQKRSVMKRIRNKSLGNNQIKSKMVNEFKQASFDFKTNVINYLKFRITIKEGKV